MEFSGKKILAPMVRFSTMPTRLLALDYGFDIVYGPEIIAQRIIGSERVEQPNGDVHYIKNGKVDFATGPKEKNKMVFQLGCSDPKLAIQAARTLKKDIDVIDLNCGCPKPFSTKGKMGAALLEDPELLCSILQALKTEIPQVTCKIRVFDDMDRTLDLVKRIKQVGVAALAVHVRTRNCKPKHPARWHYFPQIKQVLGDTPLIANGDLFDDADIQKLKGLGCDSFMAGRGAIRNLSMFKLTGKLDGDQIATDYLKKAVQCKHHYQNTKWVLLAMYPHTSSEKFKQWSQSKSLSELCKWHGLEISEDNTPDPNYDCDFPYIPRKDLL